MKKSNSIKELLILILTLICVVFTYSFVYAADSQENEFQDLLVGNNSSNTNSSNTNGANTNGSNTNSANTNRSNTNSANTNNSNTNTNAPTLNTNAIKSSNNNTNNLPKTGVGDTAPTILLVVIFGISAIYAYKKVQDYQNF